MKSFFDTNVQILEKELPLFMIDVTPIFSL